MIITTSAAVTAVICKIITTQMADALRDVPAHAIMDERGSANALMASGFGSTSVAELAGDAHAEAKRINYGRLAKATALALFVLFIITPALPDSIAPTAVLAVEKVIAKVSGALGVSP